jgi:hypothetical protein
MNCTICNEEIAVDAKKIELLCNHTFHTECWLNNNMTRRLTQVQCTACMDYVVPAEMYQTNQDVLNIENIKFLFNSDDLFKNDLSDIHKISVKSKVSYAKLKRKRNLFLKNPEIIEYVDTVKNKLKEMKKELKESLEYKESFKNNKVFLNKIKNFTEKWGVTLYNVRSVIGVTNETKKYLPDCAYTSPSTIMRYFRLNIYP